MSKRIFITIITMLLCITCIAQKPDYDLKKKKYGYSKDGKWIINPQYKSAYEFVNGSAWVEKDDDNYVLINTSGIAVSEVFEFILPSWSYDLYGYGGNNPFELAITPVKKKNSDYYSFFDRKGKLITPFKFKDVSIFSEGYAAVSEKYGEFYFIDKLGRKASQIFEGDICFPFDNGLAPYGVYISADAGFKTGRFAWGYIDKNFNIVKEAKPCCTIGLYQEIYGFHENRAIIKDSDLRKYGFIDSKGKMIVIPKYNEVTPFKNGYSVVEIPEKYSYGLIDSMGREVIEPIYWSVREVYDGMTFVKLDKVFECVNVYNGKSFKVNYDIIDNFSEGMALFGLYIGKRKNNVIKYGFIDKTGSEIVPPIYDDASSFHEGMAYVKKGDFFGFIDKTGKEVIPCIYHGVSNFSQGLALAYKSEKCGYIDKSGNIVIPFNFDRASDFCEDMAIVKKDVKYGYINKNGVQVIACKYNFCGSFNDGIAIVKDDDKYGAVDKTGKEIIPVIYDVNEIQYVVTNFQKNITTIPEKKQLSDTQRNRCENDIDYLYSLANEGYPEAEYKLAMKIYRDLPGQYSKYWSNYDESNNFVGAAHWLKKACEHGWREAYDNYAEFCFYGRGNVEGGATEAIKWLEKLVTAEPKNLNAIANIGICHIRNKEIETGYNFLIHAVRLWEEDLSLKISSDVIMDIALLNYYDIVKKEVEKEAYVFMIEYLINIDATRFSDNYKSVFQTGYEYNLEKSFVYSIYQSNIDKKQKLVSSLLKGFNEIFKSWYGEAFDIEWVNSRFNDYSGDKECDFYYLN